MRTLRFIVKDQLITQDPNCDFENLVPGTEGFVKAEFDFSDDWNGCVKVVGFYSVMGKEYTPQILRDGVSCMIPAEALERSKFKLRVIGKKKDFKITTNKITVCQNGG